MNLKARRSLQTIVLTTAFSDVKVIDKEGCEDRF